MSASICGSTPEQLVNRDFERISEFHERVKRWHSLSCLEVGNRGGGHASALAEGNLGQSPTLPNGTKPMPEFFRSASRHLTILYALVSYLYTET